jgi:hypothetical protein
MNLHIHDPLVRGRGRFISHLATPVTVTSPEVRNRIAALPKSEGEWLFENRASAWVLGSLGRSQG